MSTSSTKQLKYTEEEFKKGMAALKKRDPKLAKLLSRHVLDFKPKMQRSPFESLVRAIAHQQLHGKAAETILGRMLDLFPDKKFPTEGDLIKIPATSLRKCGFSESKTKSIKDIAAKTKSGVVPDKKSISKLSNEEIIERLTDIFGVGQWTVEMLLIFQLGRLNVWPVDDFGVRKGFQVWRKMKEMPTAKELRNFSDTFAPYQTIVALHLWREADLAKVKKPD